MNQGGRLMTETTRRGDYLAGGDATGQAERVRHFPRGRTGGVEIGVEPTQKPDRMSHERRRAG